MATQPTDGAAYKRIAGTVAGTTDLKLEKGNLWRVFLPATKTGTVSFYDEVAGSAATSLIAEVANTVGTIPTSVEFGIRVRKGLRAVYGGTVDFTVVYD